ncbi:MAG: nucleoside phosphorylase [Bacteroidales bacterium]
MGLDKKIGDSELILNPDGTIYHLKIKPEHLASTIILVGDPGRVERISRHFDRLEYSGQNREICTHTGYFRNKHLTVMSTGMGTDNIDIVLNELDALVNIDLATRTIKTERTRLTLIRLGTSGAIQPEIPLNAFVVSEYALGLDGLLHFYDYPKSIEETELTQDFQTFLKPEREILKPYGTSADQKLLGMFQHEQVYRGITLTAPGFYGPQGRRLRIPLAFPGLNKRLKEFSYKDRKIVNYEMETSALYALSKLLGHRALTVCVAIANRERHDINQNYHHAIDELISLVLQKLTDFKE